MEEQVKQPTTFEKQLLLLSEQGMEIDESLARQWLLNVSYYRMSGYWYPYRILPANTNPRNPIRLDEVLGELAAVGLDRTPFASGAIHPVKEDASHAEAA